MSFASEGVAGQANARASTFMLLTKRKFGPLFCVQFGGALNDNVLRNAMVSMIAFGVLSETIENRALMINAALGLFMLPFFLFSASAGRLADRCPERALAVRYIKAAEIATMTIAAIGLAASNAALLLVAVCCAGIQSAYFGPFKYALLPELLHKRELLGGNALMNASTYIAILLGIYWGTELGSLESPGFQVTSVLMAIAALGFLAALGMPKLHNDNGVPWAKAWSWNIFGDMASTVRSSLDVKGMLPLIVLISWFWSSGAIILTQLPVIVSDIAGFGHRSYLFALLVVCLGVAFGSLMTAVLLKGVVNTRYVPYGMLVAALGCFYPFLSNVGGASMPEALGDLPAFLAEPSHLPLLLAMFLIASSMGFYIVPLYATLQLVAPKNKRGGMVATNNIFNALFTVTGVLLAGFVVGLTEPLADAITRLFWVLGTAGIAIAAFARFVVLGNLQKKTESA